MPETSPPSSDRQPDARAAALLRGGAVLLAALGLSALLLGLYAGQQHGAGGVQSVSLAFGVCFIAALLAYSIAVFTVGTPNAMPGLMGGMLFRTGLPIVAGLVGSNASPQLQAAGFMGHCLVLFFVGLISEVWLNVRLIQSAERKRLEQRSTSETGKHIATAL